MAAEELGLEVAVKGFSSFMSDMDKMDKAIGGTASAWQKTGTEASAAASKFALVGKDIKQLATSAKETAEELKPVGMALAAIGAIGVAAIASVTKEATAFNSQAALMEVAARSSGTAFDALHDAAIRVGGDTRLVGVSATGAADAITNLYKAGQTTTQIFGDLNGYLHEGAELGGTLRASIDLAAASELDMAQGADVLSIALATFGRDASEASSIADNFVQTADASVASVSELAQAFVNVGPTAAAFGWGIEDVNIALALLSQRGIKGAEAGTVLKSMMTNLMRPVDKVQEALNELNISLYDEAGAMLSLPEIMAQLEVAMAGLTEEQRNQYIQTLAGTYGMKAMNTLLGEGEAGWKSMEKAIASAATTQQIAAVRAQTMEGQLEALEGALETVKITLGEEFLPALSKVVTALTKGAEKFAALPKPVKTAVAGMLALTTAVAGLTGGLILSLPRLITTIEAFGKLGALLPTVVSGAQSVGAGFQLIASGAGLAEVASLGLAGAISSVTVALGALGIMAGAAYFAMANFQSTEEETAVALDQMADATAMLAGDVDVLSGAVSSNKYQVEQLVEATGDLTDSWMRANDASLELAAGEAAVADAAMISSANMWKAGEAADGITGDVGGLGEAAGTASGNMFELATSASDVAKQFGEIHFDNQQLWELAMASGADTKALEELAIHLGIATEAEIQSTLEAIRLTEAFGAGTLTAEQYRDQMNNVYLAEQAATVAAAEATGEIEILRGGMEEGAMAAKDLSGNVDQTDGALSAAQKSAIAYRNALNSIPSEVRTTITTIHRSVYESGGGVSPTGGGMEETYQHGTPFVPRTGPAILHRGEAVLPVPMAQAFRQNIANNATTNNFNLTTQSITRPGGLAAEFGAMQAQAMR